MQEGADAGNIPQEEQPQDQSEHNTPTDPAEMMTYQLRAALQDKKALLEHFAPGDWVLRERKKAHKHQPNFDGPHRVVTVNQDKEHLRPADTQRHPPSSFSLVKYAKSLRGRIITLRKFYTKSTINAEEQAFHSLSNLQFSCRHKFVQGHNRNR